MNMSLSSIASGLKKVRWHGDYQLTACCPAHDDRSPSFTAKDDNGKILVKCFAGCTQEEVINALRNLGLWHTALRYQQERHKRQELKKNIPRHQLLVALGVNLSNKGIELSELDQASMKESMEFLKEHANG